MTKLEAVEATIKKYEDILEGWEESGCRMLERNVRGHCGLCKYRTEKHQTCDKCIAYGMNLCTGKWDSAYWELITMLNAEDEMQAHTIATEILQELLQVAMYLKREI